MKLSVASIADGLIVLTSAGDITLDSLVPHGDPITDLLGPTAYAQRVLINLEGSPFIDSAGVSNLIVWHRRFLRDGGRLVLFNVPPLVQQVIDLLRLDQILHLATDETAAKDRAKG